MLSRTQDNRFQPKGGGERNIKRKKDIQPFASGTTHRAVKPGLGKSEKIAKEKEGEKSTLGKKFVQVHFTRTLKQMPGKEIGQEPGRRRGANNGTKTTPRL